MSQRIKGLEIEALIVVGGQVQETITAIRSMEITPLLERKEEEYLGEKSKRYDEIFNGVRGRMEIHLENKDIFTLMQSVINRAKRREPGTQINIKATLNYPNGDRPRVQLNNVFFGEMPLGFGGRGEYVTTSLDFACEDIKILTT